MAIRYGKQLKDVVEITEAIKSFGFLHGYKLGVLSRGFDFTLFRGKAFEAEELRLKGGMPVLRNLIVTKLRQHGLVNE